MGQPQEHSQEQVPAEPRGIPGKWVLLAIFVVSVLATALTFWLVRPAPGSRPADIEDRPFGPATRGEQHDAPLIHRRGAGD